MLARVLLLKLASKINLEQNFNIPDPLTTDSNRETILIADEVKGEILADYVHMCNGNLPLFKAEFEKMFGAFVGPV